MVFADDHFMGSSAVAAVALLALACGGEDERSRNLTGSTSATGAGGAVTTGTGTAGAGAAVGGASGAPLRYDQVRQKSSHNSYQRHEALFDQLVYHRLRSLELDLHTGKSSWPTLAGSWYVYHDSNETETTCHRFRDCLDEIGAFHRAVPDHEVVTLFLDMKSDWVTPGHGPDELDAAIRSKLGDDALLTPAEVMARCPGASTLQEAVTGSCDWPALSDLRGRFLFALTGGTACSAGTVLDSYTSGGVGAEQRVGFVAPAIDGSCSLDDYLQGEPHVVFLNLPSSQTSESLDVSLAGLVSRVWDLNTSSDWGAAFNARTHVLATDKVNFHQDPWAVTHDDRGWPFDCIATCGTQPEEPADIFGVSVDSDDIWDGADSFVFLHSSFGAGDATWSGYVSTVNSHVDDFAKGCLMARASLDADSPYVAVCRPADANPIRVQVRASPGASTQAYEVDLLPADTVDDESAPFLRLELSVGSASTSATGYASLDGSTWVTIHSATVAHTLSYQGIAASSHDHSVPVTLLFGNVDRAEGSGQPVRYDLGTFTAETMIGTCRSAETFPGVFP
ncbi:MAG: hypothetical protein JRI23_18625 [Deltaproteobacteria bacterium]|jgi:hypothetical protein|nr:hypothetical protein [Deltaproteobacteria bacterium]MBW2533875.1 hypothetical protein [Deltaproteobacteria bacterium]